MSFSSSVVYCLRLPVAGLEIACPLVLNLPPWPEVQTETPLLKGIKLYPEWVQSFLNALTSFVVRKSKSPWLVILLPSVTNEPPLVSNTENSSVFRSMTRVSLSWSGVGEDTTLFEQPCIIETPTPVAQAQNILDDVLKNSLLFIFNILYYLCTILLVQTY